ncbi:DinB family protein [Ectobacillus panaciterrae]|uniref:DinB family protein n=1 Tax=Ectobacillus panaciterrae TaxID=363872 RepID=UPI0004065866|nr:DinB family protein [Ectobacillus panaciterrae]
MKHHAVQLYDYHVWANRKLFNRLKELPKELYDREIQSVFSSISAVIPHVYITDSIFLRAISGDSFDNVRAIAFELMETTKGKSAEEMEELYTELAERYNAFFDSQENMDKTIVLEHPQFGRLDSKISEIVQHVVNHGTYHRGNITAMLRQMGEAGASMDYIFYLYEIGKTE